MEARVLGRAEVRVGADIEATDRYGDRPFIMACSKGLADLARLLIERGAATGWRTKQGRSAADRAAPGMDMCRDATGS